MKKKSIKISIIIPFKNTELIWMNKLFFSLSNQTNKNFEAIFIDDNSNNGIDYKSIIKEKGYKYYLNKNNCLGNGVGKLRDFGITKAKGKYVWFVDSDDWIVDEAVEYLINAFSTHKDIDLVVFKYKWVFNSRDNKINLNKKYKEYVLNNEPTKIMTKWFHSDYQTDWRVCFRKDFLVSNNILHKEYLYIYEDVYFGLIWKTLYKKALFTTRILYFYNRMNKNSTLNIKNNFNPNILLLNIMSSRETLVKMEKFSDIWYFYANNWSFIVASCRPYKKRGENRVLINNVVGPKYYRSFSKLGLTKTWIASNFIVKRRFLVIILKKILKIYVY